MGLSSLVGESLLLCGFSAVEVTDLLQKWAAVLSKLASDSVAGIIEGIADKGTYRRVRALDYSGKLKQLFESYAQMEVVFPMEDILLLLESLDNFKTALEYERNDVVDILFVNSLDLLYFWMYQPRSRGDIQKMHPQDDAGRAKVYYTVSAHAGLRASDCRIVSRGDSGEEVFKAACVLFEQLETIFG